MSEPRIVLASASPRRADVLRQLGLDPLVRPSSVPEERGPDESPVEHVERLAREKAAAIVAEVAEEVGGAAGEDGAGRGVALIVAGDTVVVDGDRILGKPVDEADAVAMLTSLSGRKHEVLSGIAIAGPHGLVSTVARAVVTFIEVDESSARAYVATGEPMDKAGAYGIQGRGAALVERVDGDYYCVVGFPVTAFRSLLARAGWRYDFGRLTPVG